MQKYKKKPVVIEATQWDGTAVGASIVIGWILSYGGTARYHGTGQIYIDTLEGHMEASPSDWVIKGVKNEFYPCKPDIFEATYEQVSEIVDATYDRVDI